MLTIPQLKELLHIADTQLAESILLQSTLQTVPKNTTLLSEGDNVRVVPIVLEGVIKVFTTYEHRDLLLYYIEKGQSCILSVNAVLNYDYSQVNAITETDVQALLIPAEQLRSISSEYPDFKSLIISWYNERYIALLNTIKHLIYDKLDVRILDYLKAKQKVLNTNVVKVSHRQIAQELGTAREVVSRLLKKLEQQGRVVLTKEGIELL